MAAVYLGVQFRERRPRFFENERLPGQRAAASRGGRKVRLGYSQPLGMLLATVRHREGRHGVRYGVDGVRLPGAPAEIFTDPDQGRDEEEDDCAREHNTGREADSHRNEELCLGRRFEQHGVSPKAVVAVVRKIAQRRCDAATTASSGDRSVSARLL